MKNLAIIPARGGSKRIPRKNILPLNGVPLLAYTIRAAKESGKYDRIVLSSEDAEIQAIGHAEGIEVDQRPESFAGDKVTKVQVVKEYLERTGAVDEFDTVSALLPTCPFRRPEDIKAAFELFESSPLEYLIGVTEYDFPITLALDKQGDVGKVFFENGYAVTRSQDIPKYYHPNGAIYLATVEAFLRAGTFFQPEMLVHEMDAIRSFDIDYPYQFTMAEELAKQIANNEL